MSAGTKVATWVVGAARQWPATHRTRVQRYRARIYLRGGGWREQLCEHEHESERAAQACGAVMAQARNLGR